MSEHHSVGLMTESAGGTDAARAGLQTRLVHEQQVHAQAEQWLSEKSHALCDALQAVQASEQRLQTVLWASGEALWEWSAHGRGIGPRELVIQHVGREPLRWTERELLGRIAPDDREAMKLAWRLHVSGAHEAVDVAGRLLIEQELRWVHVRGRSLSRDEAGRPLRVVGTVKDITVQRAAEATLHTMAQAFASAQDALVVVDPQWRVIETNQSLRQLLRLPQTELLGCDLRQWLHLPRVPKAVVVSPELPGAALAASPVGDALAVEGLLRRADRAVPVEVQVTEVGGQASCLIVAVRDLSERRHSQAQLERLAWQDTLTELPNRPALQRHLDHCVAARAPDGSFGLLFMDLDGFKAVNDSQGHDKGDLLLVELAQRLREALPQAYIARWGGDEFAIVLPGGSGEFDIRDAAQLLIAKLSTPFGLGQEHEARISASLGAVICPTDGVDATVLLRKADSAMYSAKEAGRNCLRMFEPLIEESAVRRVRMQGQLREDAERNAFTFVAQPKVDRQGRPTGAEVLVRWNTREFGAVSPAEFIPIAEQSSTIELLGRHALHTAAQLAAQVRALGFVVPVAVNLSPRQLRYNGFERLALRACELHGIEPSQLELELTESALASDSVLPLLRRLRGHGFSLALDDFGTGYSSLSHLLHLPFHKVKIDRAFVKDLLQNTRARAVIRGTIQICRDLGLTTVAEGVETREQFELLCDLGLDEFQGYLFARPLRTEDWLSHLSAGAPPPDWMALPG